MDIFATLPPELLAPILSKLPDLRSLFNAFIASPHIFRFLSGPLGGEVLDNILESSAQNLTATPWIPHIIRLVVLIRYYSPMNQPASDLASFITKFIMPTTFENADGQHTPDLQSRPPDCMPRIKLSPVTQGPHSVAPRDMIFLADRINSLSMECFDFFHKRIKAASPQHLTDKRYHLGTLPWTRRPDGRKWGQSYNIDAGGKASWYEKQRIILGFWCLQLCYELSNAALDGRLKWPALDVKMIRDMGSGETCLSGLRESRIWIAQEPLWSALLYVRHVEGVLDESPCVGDTDIVNSGLSVFLSTGFEPLRSRHYELPPPRQKNKGIGRSIDNLHPPSFSCIDPNYTFTYHCHKALFGCQGLRWAGPLLCPRESPRLSEGLLFRPFRRLGFGIWDDERLVQMEMLDDPENKRPRRFHVWCQDQIFTWTSLLSPEEKEELRVYQEALQLREELEFGELIVGGS
ncbi:hypothetical protein FHETE_8470 [Fusarium heterosporum]|uniref:F-box domain-containing protein n=1 Tax=Fusarium heterosporum TaxID=42747 RepID=A0A8H5T1J0_FUSHE|nr:hypothetical protein FHETE_8470 [Fusarium heterosporum]